MKSVTTVGPRLDSRQAGFSLVEVTAGMIILITCVTALGSLFPTVSQQRERDMLRGEALRAARSALEEIKSIPAESLVGEYAGFTGTLQEESLVDASGVDDGAQVRAVEPVLRVNVVETSPKLLDVTITTNWESCGIPESLTLHTQIYNRRG